jgi:transcription elongation factor Elf1
MYNGLARLKAMPEAQLPWCYKCNKKVDRCVVEFDVISLDNIFTVMCHGESKFVRLSALQSEMNPKAAWADLCIQKEHNESQSEAPTENQKHADEDPSA